MAVYNPDVLTCLANLSNDEVFTPPQVANDMLDMLPKELFSDPNTTFLDPTCKSGVFLREIAKRLIKGLKDKIPDLQERLDHIYHKQLFGIAITELTGLASRRSLYCSKYPNRKYSVSHFDDVQGNIRFKNTNHIFKNGRCVFCGATEGEFGESQRNGLELHAYEFIHTTKPEEIFNMKFDVVIGNPPYQLEDEGNGKSAKPIYQLFVQQAIKLNPRFLVMIIPARWYSGGKGLDDFRKSMLNDGHIRRLVDYPNYKDVFFGLGGLSGGACYFLWNRDDKGPCEMTNVSDGVRNTSIRKLNEFDVLIRDNRCLTILKKVLSKETNFLDKRVSSRKPFGLPTNYQPQKSGIPCYFIQKIGLKYALEKDVSDSFSLKNKWKLLAPSTPIAGQTDFTKPVGFYYDGNTVIASPGEICTESFIVLGAFDTKEELLSYKSYIFTKTARFLLLQTVISQHVTKGNFCFVPDFIDYKGRYTDEQLCYRWGIDKNEWSIIDSKISNIGEKNNG